MMVETLADLVFQPPQETERIGIVPSKGLEVVLYSWQDQVFSCATEIATRRLWGTDVRPIIDDTLSVLTDKSLSSADWQIASRLVIRRTLWTASKYTLKQKELRYVVNLCVDLAPIHVHAWHEEETRFDGYKNDQAKFAVLQTIESVFTSHST
jgi:hypothetical protein